MSIGTFTLTKSRFEEERQMTCKVTAYDEHDEFYATIKSGLTASVALKLCRRLRWRIAEFGEHYDLYIEDDEQS